MKIAIDIQGVQSNASSSRGIGRYSFDIIKNLIKNYPENEYILVSNSALKNLRSEFRLELSNSNVSYFEWFAPISNNLTNYKHYSYKITLALRTFSLKSLDVDIILITSFLEGYSDNCFTDLDLDKLDTPVLSIFYDLIPLINSKLYLDNNQYFAEFYKHKLNQIREFDGLLSISYSSSQEAIKYLDFEAHKVFNISSACDPNIFKQSPKNSHQIINNFSVDTHYLMYSGASDPRKNVRGLLEAFSQLSPELNHYKLILVGKLLPPEIDLIDNWICDFGILPEKVIKLGYVSTDQLVTLYQNCNLFIFPSLHEGFGLPVLEAMSCGAPVIASNRTSIPEVVGDQRAMFDPENTGELIKLIHKALFDSEFNLFLLKNADKQKKKFSWYYSSSLLINALRKIYLSKKLTNNLDNWSTYVQFRNQNISGLISYIKNLDNIKLNKNPILVKQLSSCIDLICISLNGIIRKRFLSYDSISWKIEGPFDSNYSLALVNTYFVKSLIGKVKDIDIHITEGLGDYDPDMSYLKKDELIYALYTSNNSLNSNSIILSRNLYPPRVNDMSALLNMLHAYGWEESVFPSEWVEQFNTSLQCITVMSSEVKRILINNGVSIPIKVCGLGLDHINDIETDNNFCINAKSYKFLHISSCFPRKGVDLLLQAFADAFTNSDDVSLIIKTFDNPHNNIEYQLEKIRQNNHYLPDVKIIKDNLSLGQLKSLYLQCDALVAPSRGEGFGLPIGEAMLLGIPVITTGWGGQKDFCNDSNCWLLDYQFSKAKTHFNLDFSYWAEPSISHLTTQLKNVYSSNQSQLLKKTKLAQETTRLFSWDKVTEINKSFACKSVLFSNDKSTKVGWVSTWNTNCGIASYSRHIVEKMSKEVVIFNPLSDLISKDSEFVVVPSWQLDCGDGNSFDILFNEIIFRDITTLVIQFNYGFFDFTEFNEFIKKVKSKKINLIIFLHSTIDPVNNSLKSLSIIRDSLCQCDRLIVHTISDINRLKILNLINNVCLIPHGILDFNPTKSKPLSFLSLGKYFNKNHRRIASFGFCLPSKGYFELIQAISILKEKKLNVHLDIFSAIYNSQYISIYEDLKKLITTLNLQSLISIDTKYYSDEEILDNLSDYDLTIFPYQNSNESSSAAVRHGLASLRPVLVTPLPIFDDVSDFVHYLPGTSSLDIAEGLLNWYQKIEQNINFKNNSIYSENYFNKLKKIRFSKLAKRLTSIIKSLEMNLN